MVGLDEAMKRAEEQARAEAFLETSRMAEEAPQLASIQAELDELSTETLSWLSANPRPQVILARATVTPRSGASATRHSLVIEHRGWQLGRFFLTDGGILHSFVGVTWFPQFYMSPAGWDEQLASEAARQGVSRIGASRSWSRNDLDGPVYGSSALAPMHPVIRQTSTEWTVPSELYRARNGVVMSSGNWEPFSDIIAKELLKLTP